MEQDIIQFIKGYDFLRLGQAMLEQIKQEEQR